MLDEMFSSDAPFPSLDWQLRRGAALAYRVTVGVWPGAVSPLDALPKIGPRPVLLIHGEAEFERSQGRRQYDAARAPKELWVVPGSGYGGYRQAVPEEYARRIREFFERAYMREK
jgi:fermentation-respiration switch protein FrsA (DUF1100 family)